jgi:hypothetical protein
MVSNLTRPLTLSVLLLAASCSFVDDTLLPPLTGDEAPAKAGADSAVPIAASKAEGNMAPTLSEAGTSAMKGTPVAKPNPYKLPGVTAGAPTGTVVGERVEALRNELAALQQRIDQHSGQFGTLRTATTTNSQRYHGTMAAINTRLQIGTTKGNPILIGQWNEAQQDLEEIASDVSAMSSLANDVAGDASEAGFLVESTRSAFDLSGAIEEDHRQLTILEDEATRTSVLANRMLNELTGSISRQNAYVGAERSNLASLSVAIKNGGFQGTSAGSRDYLNSAGTSSDTSGTSRQALVIIRFDRDDVQYEQALYDAVSQTMQERPQSSFDVVSITPLQSGGGNIAASQAKSSANAERVLRSLTNMGLPANRVSLSSTSNAQVASNEVHIYVR